jgi:aminoglycoside 6'-N-acetyltransferase
MTAEPIIGDRVLLRPYDLDDIDSVYAYYSRTDVSRYLLTTPMSREAVEAMVAARALRVCPQRSGEALALVVEHAGRVVGDVVLILAGTPVDGGEVGWVLNPAFGGCGLATDAARLLLRHAFDHYELGSVTARLDGRNLASVGLCKRLGMDLVGADRQDGAEGVPIEVLSYVMTAERWRARTLQARAALVRLTSREERARKDHDDQAG